MASNVEVRQGNVVPSSRAGLGLERSLNKVEAFYAGRLAGGTSGAVET
jgi:hypothetical protein